MAYLRGEPFTAQFIDPATGLLMQNGTIEFYLSETSTPTPYYTNSTGTSGGTSLTLDSGGQPPNNIFFDDGISYKIVTKNASGATLQTIDPYNVISNESSVFKRQYIADLTSEAATIGNIYMVEDYASGNNAGVMYFRAVAAGTGTADGGSYIDHDTLSVQFERIFNSVVSVKDFGFSEANTGAENTNAFNAAVAHSAGNKLITPRGSYSIAETKVENFDDIVLDFVDNSFVEFQPGTILTLDPTASIRYKIFHIRDVSNVRIVGNFVKIIGDRTTPTTGEYGHGVNIEGAENVRIENVVSTDCWGDGFYVGAGTQGYSKNVKTIGCSADNNRRQGLSLVSCDGFKDYGSNFDNTNGTSPACGVDVEPDLSTQILKNIRFYGSSAKGNNGGGFFTYLKNLNDTSASVDIKFIGCRTEDNCNLPATHGIYSANEVKRVVDVGANPPQGSIDFIDCVSDSDQYSGFLAHEKSAEGVRVRFIRPTVINPNQSGSLVSISQSHGVGVFSPDATYTDNPGGVDIIDPIVIDKDGNLTDPSLAQIMFQGQSTSRMNDIVIKNPTLESGSTRYQASSNAKLVTIDDTRMPEIDAGGSISIYPRHLGQITTNQSQIGSSWIMYLPTEAQSGVGTRYTFKCKAAQNFRLEPDGTEKILPGGGAGKYLSTNIIGSSITVERISSAEWCIVSQIGTWTFEP